ncbi:hypothetical protein EX30DRAFT_36015 [Ascodesmis nigricans]|uniref:Uncharacterized protein n=1 Tax=Ascodesmis nigricans TaxID=341454 RepID=A0A4S2MWN6_9PEZI|nr:hypothetical protein EX30DRAFT_36015 [Ascodesmis nigricans]
MTKARNSKTPYTRQVQQARHRKSYTATTMTKSMTVSDNKIKIQVTEKKEKTPKLHACSTQLDSVVPEKKNTPNANPI